LAAVVEVVLPLVQMEAVLLVEVEQVESFMTQVLFFLLEL
jgi:hypothetical protein